MTADSEIFARLEQATAWHVRLLADPGIERTREFSAWYSGVSNRVALADVRAAWSALDEHGAAPEVIGLRRSALARAQRTASRRWRPSSNGSYMAAAALAAVTLSLTFFVNWRLPADYETTIGERRVVTLTDGSRLSLDSDSEVHVRYTRDTRSLVLDRGRARFDVTHDMTRPFTVVVGNERVVAVGTSFDVERLGEKITVTLLEGRVIVGADAIPPRIEDKPAPVLLNPGQQWVVAAAKAPAVSETNLQTAKAWEAGTLVFNDEPLSEAAARVNRYSRTSITIEPEAANIRISGVFNAGDVASFVDAVSTYFPIEATLQKNKYVLRPSH